MVWHTVCNKTVFVPCNIYSERNCIIVVVRGFFLTFCMQVLGLLMLMGTDVG